MALAALADLSAATTAGYKEIVNDNGIVGSTRFTVTLEKPSVGDPDGGSGSTIRAYGQGSTQNAAETAAVAALNGQRLQRYGADSGPVSTGKKNTNAHTVDKT